MGLYSALHGVLCAWTWGTLERMGEKLHAVQPLKGWWGVVAFARVSAKHGYGFGYGGCFALTLAFLGRPSGFAKSNNLDS